MKHLFIINPKAGKGHSLSLIPYIKEILSDLGDEYIIETTKKPGHATELVREYVEKENYRVYSIGGDGTLNEVLNGMVNSKSILGIIPSGSGNDFIKSIYKKKVSKNILKETILGNYELLDLAKVNNRYFINISSVGIDAQVAFNARKFKKIPLIPGRLAYLISIFVTIFKFKSQSIKIQIDNKNFVSQITLLAAANGRYYGGGMKVAPNAELRDGYLDICFIRKISKIKILTLFPKLINGTHEDIKEVSFFKGKKITLESKNNLYINLDGELSISKNIQFEVIPKGINIIIPQP